MLGLETHYVKSPVPMAVVKEVPHSMNYNKNTNFIQEYHI